METIMEKDKAVRLRDTKEEAWNGLLKNGDDTESGKRRANENPKQVFGDSKVPLHLVPPALIQHCAIALLEGGEKYGLWNYRENQIGAMTYVGQILRHLQDFVDGIDVDPDSKYNKLSLAGVASGVAILLDAIENNNLIDDRPPRGNSRQTLDRLQKDIIEGRNSG